MHRSPVVFHERALEIPIIIIIIIFIIIIIIITSFTITQLYYQIYLRKSRQQKLWITKRLTCKRK